MLTKIDGELPSSQHSLKFRKRFVLLLSQSENVIAKMKHEFVLNSSKMAVGWRTFSSRSHPSIVPVRPSPHPGLILHGGNEGDCLRVPWSLPWCPWNAPVQICNFIIGCPLPRRNCLGALALSTTKHTALLTNILRIYYECYYTCQCLYEHCQLLCTLYEHNQCLQKSMANDRHRNIRWNLESGF